jgi:hypothetical protein
MKTPFLNNKSGFASIVEVVVTAIIFTLAAFGIFTSIASLRPEGAQSGEKLDAALMAKGKLEELRQSLSPDLWNSGGLSLGTHTLTEGNFTYTWTVTEVPSLEDFVRKVDMTVEY